MPRISDSSPRRGVSPTLLRLPPGADLAEQVFIALASKGTAVSRADVVAAIGAGDIGYENDETAYIHRPIPDEADIDLPVLLENDRIIAVDKPAGISSTPQGSFVARSVLVQARRQFGDKVTCAHRLDRATSGVMLLVKDPAYRGTYQQMFENETAYKTYEFLARAVADVTRERASRLVAQGGQSLEVPGEPNARTKFRLLDKDSSGTRGRYEAVPLTGKTHQIRVHAAGAGFAILGDTLYGPGEGFPDRIELLAQRLSFTDPVDETSMDILSKQELSFPE